MLFAALKRDHYGDVETLGTLRLQGWGSEQVIQLETLELPWKDNRNRESCIPEGEYDVEIREAEESEKYNYKHFHVKDVPERKWILIHAGNFYTHTLGCILVGHYRQHINEDGTMDIADSKNALRNLIKEVEHRNEKGFRLKIYSEKED